MYIDCNIEKSFVREIKRINSLTGVEELATELEYEFDIDSLDYLFDNDFFNT